LTDRDAEFDRLVAKHLAGEVLSPEERDRFSALFAGDKQLAKEFAAEAILHYQLRTLAVHERPEPDSRQRNWMRTATLIVAVAATVLVTVIITRKGPGTVPDNAVSTIPDRNLAAIETTDPNVAVLAKSVGAEWENAARPLASGSPLPSGRLSLMRGLAQIEFYSGAVVVIEGPAEVRIDTPMKAHLTRGKLRAVVPPQAVGFAVTTLRFDVIDRGTEFAVRAGDNGDAEVHVFRGRVEVAEPGSGVGRSLAAGSAERWGTDGSRIATPPASHGFASTADVDDRIRAAAQHRHEQWQSASKALATDPSLLVYYPFEEPADWDRTLTDVRPQGNRPGSLIGATWVEGRWPGKKAVEFSKIGDRVLFHVPGEYEAISMAAWVRVDRLDRAFNALMLSDGYDRGALHWQIAGEPIGKGELILGVSNGTGGTDFRTDKPVFSPSVWGRWVHLAVVCDTREKTVTHYLDGKPVAATAGGFGKAGEGFIPKEPFATDVKLRIGDAQLGNWNERRRSDKRSRALTGRIDEFAMFGRSLTEAEVLKLYEDGRPE
jgi:hypothetical protein